MRRLKIRGSTLSLYALLYSFTNGRIGLYYGSRKRLADYLDVSERTVYRGLKALREASLIENGISEDGMCGIRCAPIKATENKAEKKDEEISLGDAVVEKIVARETRDSNMSEGYINMIRMNYRYIHSCVKEPKFLSFGRRGYITMTEPQYRELIKLLPMNELMLYFDKVERMIEATLDHPGVKKCPHNHYKTIRKWIEEDTAL